MAPIQVAILTVSDTAAADATADKSGPALKRALEAAAYAVTHTLIVPDDDARIQLVVSEWAARADVDWILTTGGTGFGVRDRTPEAIAPLLERDAPGLVHLLLAASLQHTPLAALSRPVAGTLRDTLVITLPGSAKAVGENLDALLAAGVIPHAVELIRGGDGRRVHRALGAGREAEGERAERHRRERSHGHGHRHSHSHSRSHSTPQPRTALAHDPALPPSARHRVSPYPLVSLEAALDAILTEVRPLDTCTLPVTPALAGHVLAENVHAPHDLPAAPTTNVDGYALRSTDAPGVYPLAPPHARPLPPGTLARINTGAPLPPGADAVVMVEDTRLTSAAADGEERAVETLARVRAGENVRAPGSDVRRGALVLERGERCGAAGGEIGTLAFVGRTEVTVYRKPVVALLSTGNELVDIQAPAPPAGDAWGGIYDTNRPALHAALAGMGYEVVDLGIVPDDLDAHVAALSAGLARADLVLTTGGTSMGATDLLKPVVERHLGGTVHFGRVAVKPGKPTTFATVPRPDADAGAGAGAAGVAKDQAADGDQAGADKGKGKGADKEKGAGAPPRRIPLFALPGNPASALVTFQVFVVPALRKLGGWPTNACQLPRVAAQLQTPMALDARTEFHRVVLQAGPAGLAAHSTGGQRSSRVASLRGANALVVLPQQPPDAPPRRLEAGAVVEAIVIGEIQMASA